TVTDSIAQADTSTSIASSVNPSVFGRSVTFTATVTSNASAMTGTVTFFDGGSSIGASSLDSLGTASLTTSTLSPGTHSISASYSGDANFSGSTTPAITQTVDQADTTTSISSSLNPSVFGQSLTFTATVSAVSPGAGTPGGTVTFQDGASTLGT